MYQHYQHILHDYYLKIDIHCSFIRIIASHRLQPVPLHTNILTSPSVVMSFTISLINTLPNINGKEGEISTKFINESEIDA
ncbi:unnamed protein product [Rotaria sordida]|uniref:Uncharacterized protein n=1 Tax=Rotaria sordida TaxID=392033 RepID=A0A814ICW5_9BILA|nr:unnamed protein product [Rotaria sordida]CAF1138331.1 unnamed protein product [Rotaria sordida]CAF1141004.1 unnamed protein product [Rotaria sordida]